MLSFASAGTCVSADSEMDMDLMQSIDGTAKSINSDIDLKDSAAASADARELEQQFQLVLAFYAARHDAPDAVNFSKTSLDLTETIMKSVAARDFETASRAAAQLTHACRACHDVYKPLT